MAQYSLGMSLATAELPTDPAELHAFALACQSELKVAELSVQYKALEIEKLKLQIAKLRRMQFGRSSERITRQIEQLELRLEELQTGEAEVTDQWSPTINLGASVLIPEDYVADLNVRMSLYRRLAGIGTREEIDRFAAELIDRFGPLPDEVKHLFEIVTIKQLAKQAGVEKIDAGPKGGTIAFRNNAFANPVKLIQFVRQVTFSGGFPLSERQNRIIHPGILAVHQIMMHLA